MSLLRGKKVLLGVTAGIAAYKTTYLVRAFVKAGAQVKVIMTPASKEFVTPLSLSTLSKNPVYSSFTKEESQDEVWTNHVELGLWADFFVIAPATANTMSKMASGTCDNLLLATYLSAKCPVYFAPAMDLDMYKHPSTAETFKTLSGFGDVMIPATSGELASGLVGLGRMAEPDEIVQFIVDDIKSKLPLLGKTVLITAGPTYEAIDPVRFVGNHSSGKMGVSLAYTAAKLGAQVQLILGPSALNPTHDAIHVQHVVSAQQMFDAVHTHYANVDVAIAAAAVADYRPKAVATQKIKKSDAEFTITLEKTVDILLSMGKQKQHQKLIGFALETQNEVQNALKKLKKKNLDAIVLNSLQDKGAGFKTKTNKITFITKDQNVIPYDLKDKTEVADDIFTEILKMI